MVSNLSDRYWHERFDGARRVTPSGNVQPAEVAPD